jgi:uncharacterized protein
MTSNPEHRFGSKHMPAADCWLHEAIDVRVSPIEGQGLFCRHGLPAGTVVARLGGRLVSDRELERLIFDAERDRDRPYVDSIAVDDDRNLLIRPGQPIHFGNHSCDPNLWHVGPFILATRRDIATGEELTIDYATQTANARVRFACRCGSSQCRGTVTGEDWRRGELRERYGDHWVPTVLHRIAALAASPTSRARRTGTPIELHPVDQLANTVASVLDDVRGDLEQLVPGLDIEHIGATSLPDGVTKSDVDLNVRVSAEQFDQVVAVLSTRFGIAQPQNWTATYASFSDDLRDLPVGIQVTVKGSNDDFLVMLRDRLRSDADLRRDYNRVKHQNAPAGADAYWQAKNEFFQRLRG